MSFARRATPNTPADVCAKLIFDCWRKNPFHTHKIREVGLSIPPKTKTLLVHQDKFYGVPKPTSKFDRKHTFALPAAIVPPCHNLFCEIVMIFLWQNETHKHKKRAVALPILDKKYMFYGVNSNRPYCILFHNLHKQA